MKYHHIIILGALLSLLAGCFKDKGNYDLHPINEVTPHASVGDTVYVQQFDTLRIAVQLEQSIPVDDARIQYRWNVYPYPNGGTNLELGTSRDLEAPIGLKAGKYTLQYTVTDLDTGIPHIKTYLLEVTGLLSEGWLVLQNKTDGTQDVAIINPDGTIIPDLYRTANGEPLPAGTDRVNVLNPSIFQHIFLYGAEDAVQVEPSNFGRLNGLSDWFMGGGVSGHVSTHFYLTYGYGAFIMVNGDVYVYQGIPHVAIEYGAAVRGDWELSKYAIQLDMNSEAIFYDTKHQRFLKFTQNDLNEFSNPTGSAFDMRNVGKELVFAGPSLSTYYNCVMKDEATGQFYVYRVNYSGAIAAAEVYTIDDAPGIAQATHFASSKLYYHIYYAVGNKLYLLDIPAKKARLVYTFPADETVSALKLKQSMALFEMYDDNNKTLGVATEANGAGKVYVFSISNTGDFEADTYKHVYDGFDPIIDLNYKNKPF